MKIRDYVQQNTKNGSSEGKFKLLKEIYAMKTDPKITWNDISEHLQIAFNIDECTPNAIKNFYSINKDYISEYIEPLWKNSVNSKIEKIEECKLEPSVNSKIEKIEECKLEPSVNSKIEKIEECQLEPNVNSKIEECQLDLSNNHDFETIDIDNDMLNDIYTEADLDYQNEVNAAPTQEFTIASDIRYSAKDKASRPNNVRLSIFEMNAVIFTLINYSDNNKYAKNIKKYLDISRLDMYVDEESSIRLDIIKKLVDMSITLKIRGSSEMISIFNSKQLSKNEKDIFNEIANQSINCPLYNTNFLEHVEKEIVSTTNLSPSLPIIETIIEKYNAFRSGEANDKIIEQLSDLFSRCNSTLRNAKVSLNTTNNDEVSEETLDDSCDRFKKELNTTSSVLKTKIAGLDKCLDGGFPTKAVSVFAAASGHGKSIVLQDSLYWILENNTFEPSVPGKIPYIMYISLENSITDYMKRLCKYEFGDNYADKIKYMSDDEYKNRLYKYTSYNGTKVIAKFFNSNEMSSDDIYDIINEYKDNNYEIKYLVVDYIEPMKAIVKSDSQYLEMGEKMYELRNIAKKENIPVVTAAQLNRAAYGRMADATTFSEKLAIFDEFNGSLIADSIKIKNAADVLIFISREIGDDGDARMLFKPDKGRNYEDRTLFYAKFKTGNAMKFDETYGTVEYTPTAIVSQNGIKVMPNSTRRVQ